MYYWGGFVFDVGLMIIMVFFFFEELFGFFGEWMDDIVEMCKFDFWYCVWFDDGCFFDFYDLFDVIVEEIVCFSFEDVVNYGWFIDEMGDIYCVGFEELGD